MRVQVNLTIELDELPDYVRSKLDESEQKLASQLDNIKENLSLRKVAGSVVASELMALRITLSEFENLVQDMNQVMQAYENAVLQREAAFLEQQAELTQMKMEAASEAREEDEGESSV
tara:strand:- start:474 stop:827 length:354 start_codon:yes stop_codon:yes gene_type:complete